MERPTNPLPTLEQFLRSAKPENPGVSEENLVVGLAVARLAPKTSTPYPHGARHLRAAQGRMVSWSR
jgi:hypothetical protein